MNSILETVRRRFAFSEDELATYIGTAPYRYKTYRIPKRSGGTREISQPSKDLKIIQRYILEKFLSSKFKFHQCATAYQKNKNIADNARPHLHNSYLLKMDFSDFFPSIKAADFVGYLRSAEIALSEQEASDLARLFFKHTNLGLRLSIGSPGSPAISNALLMTFDSRVHGMVSEREISYTRYSDDMTFSTNLKDVLFEIPLLIENILQALPYPILSINKDKTIFSSKKFNRHVTGVTISNDGKMSIGHQNKRILRTRVFEVSKLSVVKIAQLKGYLSFINQIEPDFILKLRSKYPLQMRVLERCYH